LTRPAIDNGLCYCTILIHWLGEKKEVDTEIVEFELSNINSRLDELKTSLYNQTKTDEIKLNIIEPLIEQLQAIAQTRENISSLLTLQQSCTLQIIVENLKERGQKLLRIKKKDEHLLDELDIYLNEINKRIEKDTAKIQNCNTTVGAGATAAVCCGLAYLYKRKNLTLKTAIGVVFTGAVVGAVVGYCRGWWVTSVTKKQGKEEGKELCNKQRN